MIFSEIMEALESMGSEQTRKTFRNHGAPENMFGVKVGDLKTIVKKVKKNHEISLLLYASGNSDAQYLAGLIADEKKISKADLERWVKEATWHMQSEYTVPWIAAESPYGLELAKEWIQSKEEKIASAGWCTLSSLAGTKADATLDIPFFDQCLDLILRTIHQQPNRVRHCMNGFIIATGCGITKLTQKAKKIAAQLGTVTVEMGNTSCKVPDAIRYIEKVENAGKVGNKKKMARC